MNKQVWVIEDDPDIRDVISFLLQEEGHEVRLFENASTFKTALGEQMVPDLFLVDVMLPDGNGIAICQELLKGSEAFKHIPIIIMSAHVALGKFQQSCNAEEFIPKPFNIDTLLDKVNRLLA